jgi:SAM-dependent methyltransferase
MAAQRRRAAAPPAAGPAAAAKDRSEAYAAFAYAYDQALGFRFHNAVRKLLSHANELYPAKEMTHLDVACGTGLTVAFYQSLGWKSVGADASLPMLAVAKTRGQRLVAGDYRALPLRGTFERITCLYDSFNHLKERADLTRAFRSIAGLMDASSLLLFDMNHPDIYPEVWGTTEPFVASGESYHLEIATSFRKRELLGHALVTGWARLPGSDERVPIHETHEQRSYTEREIVRSLSEAGLAPVEVVDFDPYDEENVSATVKLFFICRKKS